MGYTQNEFNLSDNKIKSNVFFNLDISTESLLGIANKTYEEISLNYNDDQEELSNCSLLSTPINILFLLRFYQVTKEEKALKISTRVLDKILKGKDMIFDSLSSSDYSDEKIVIDKLMLLICCRYCFSITKEERYLLFSEEIMKSLDEKNKTIDGVYKIHQHRDNFPTNELYDETISINVNALSMVANSLLFKTTNNNKYLTNALLVYNYIKSNLYLNNKLYSTDINNQILIDTNEEDYVYLAWGLLELHQINLINEELEFSIKLTDLFLNNYYDKKSGAIFYSLNNQQKIVNEDISDSFKPDEKSILVYVLSRLAKLTGNNKFESISSKILYYYYQKLNKDLTLKSFFVINFLLKFQKIKTLSISAHSKKDVEKTLRYLNKEGNLFLDVILTKDKPEKTTYYVITDKQYSQPIIGLTRLEKILKEIK